MPGSLCLLKIEELTTFYQHYLHWTRMWKGLHTKQGKFGVNHLVEPLSFYHHIFGLGKEKQMMLHGPHTGWTTLPEAANACHELLKCGCKKSCTNRCKRTSSGRCCAPVEGSLMDRFEPSHSMTAWIVQHCRCNSSYYYGLNRNVFSGKRAAPVVNLHYFTLKLLL